LDNKQKANYKENKEDY